MRKIVIVFVLGKWKNLFLKIIILQLTEIFIFSLAKSYRAFRRKENDALKFF